MKALFLLISLCMFVTGCKKDKAADSTVDVGDTVPSFSAKDDTGEVWNSAAHVGKSHLVFYFYPGDFTPGCTLQAQTFRDDMTALTQAGISVVGISGDSVEAHRAFKKAQKLPFTLLSDSDGSVAKKFGVKFGGGGQVRQKIDGKLKTFKRGVTISRWTFVADRTGKIIYKNTSVDPSSDSQSVLKAIANN